MSNVIQLDAHRKPTPAPRRTRPSAESYFCKRCDEDTFTLAATGEVLCANCRARMNNLSVVLG